MFRSSMTLDGMNRAMTIAVGMLVAVAFFFVRGSGSVPGIFGYAVAVASLTLAAAMSPCEVVVDQGEVRVVRRAWPPLCIPLTSIDTVATIDGLGWFPLRLFGTGGFFGSFGLFRSGALGRFRLYATRSGRAVVVRRKDGDLPLVLTPDDVEGTVGAIRGRAALGERGA